MDNSGRPGDRRYNEILPERLWDSTAFAVDDADGDANADANVNVDADADTKDLSVAGRPAWDRPEAFESLEAELYPWDAREPLDDRPVDMLASDDALTSVAAQDAGLDQATSIQHDPDDAFAPVLSDVPTPTPPAWPRWSATVKRIEAPVQSALTKRVQDVPTTVDRFDAPTQLAPGIRAHIDGLRLNASGGPPEPLVLRIEVAIVGDSKHSTPADRPDDHLTQHAPAEPPSAQPPPAQPLHRPDSDWTLPSLEHDGQESSVTDPTADDGFAARWAISSVRPDPLSSVPAATFAPASDRVSRPVPLGGGYASDDSIEKDARPSTRLTTLATVGVGIFVVALVVVFLLLMTSLLR